MYADIREADIPGVLVNLWCHRNACRLGRRLCLDESKEGSFRSEKVEGKDSLLGDVLREALDAHVDVLFAL